jgi:hypothetical protein
VQLYARGANFTQIARQMGLDISTVAKAFKRAVVRIPKADIEALRKLEGERIQTMRFSLFNELAGREREVDDPDNPGKKKRITFRPEPELVIDIVDKAVKVSRHEALLFGLDAPTKADIVSRVTGQAISDEELDAGLARLTEEEREQFMMLLAKLEGRWVEPPPPSVETTAIAIEPPRNANGSGESNG